MTNALLECCSLGVQMDGKWLLQPLSLSLSSGELLVLSGHNGAGKSTLLNAIVGLRALVKSIGM